MWAGWMMTADDCRKRNLLVKPLLFSKNPLWDGAWSGLLRWWGKMPQIKRQFTVVDVVPWSYPISWTQVKLSRQEPWDGEYPHLCWQIQMDHLGTVGLVTKATERTCSRAGHRTRIARPPLGCGKQGHGGLAAQQRSGGLRRGLSSKHWCTIQNGEQGLQSIFATQNPNAKSLT